MECEGKGKKEIRKVRLGQPAEVVQADCPTCHGTGLNTRPEPLSYMQLSSRLLNMMSERGIDPSQQNIVGYFAKSADPEIQEKARYYLDASLLREIEDEAFALEPLGLAYWRVALVSGGVTLAPGELEGEFPKLTSAESETLLNAVISVLVNIRTLTAPNHPEGRAPWDWGPDRDQVKPYQKKYPLLLQAKDGQQSQTAISPIPAPTNATGSKSFHFNFGPYHGQKRYKLGRYMTKVGNRMVALGRLTEEKKEDWLETIRHALFQALKDLGVLTSAGAKLTTQKGTSITQYGIRMDRLRLHPIPETVAQCHSCGYVTASTFLDTCVRCGKENQPGRPDFHPELLPEGHAVQRP